METNQMTQISENIVSKNWKSEPFHISRRPRWLIFAVLLCLTFVMNMDSGVISGTTSEIRSHFNISDSQLGNFGSVNFIGNTIGAVISISIINKYSRKNCLIITTIISAVSLWWLTWTKKYYLLLSMKTLIGFSSSYHTIYSPVWFDQFGVRKKRSLKIALFHVISPVGYIFGYVTGILTSWIIAFIIQVVLSVVLIIIICFFCDEMYFSRSILPKKQGNDDNMNCGDETKQQSQNNNNNNNNNDNDNFSQECQKESGLPKVQENKSESKEMNTIEDDNISLFEDMMVTKEKDVSKESVSQQICLVWNSPIFVFMTWALCAIYFVVTGIQFWVNDYMKEALDVNHKTTRMILFTLVCATSPMFGILLGGIITTMIGGYDKKNSIYIPLIASALVSVSALFVTISRNKYIFSSILWVYLFFGSLTLPSMTGIILTSVPKGYSGSASAISTCLYNIFGKFPPPLLYGAMKDYIKDKRSRLPMTWLINFSWVGFIFMLASLKFNVTKYQELEDEMFLKQDIENNRPQKGIVDDCIIEDKNNLRKGLIE